MNDREIVDILIDVIKENKELKKKIKLLEDEPIYCSLFFSPKQIIEYRHANY